MISAPTAHFECRCNCYVRLVECNSSPVSHARLDSVHKCTQSGLDNLLEASCNCSIWCFHEILKSVCGHVVLTLSLMILDAVHLMLQMFRNFYLTNWNKEFYLINQKMLRNIRSSKWTVARHSLCLKIDIQPIASILILSWVIYMYSWNFWHHRHQVTITIY